MTKSQLDTLKTAIAMVQGVIAMNEPGDDVHRCEACGVTCRNDEPLPDGWAMDLEEGIYACPDCVVVMAEPNGER